MTEQKRLPGQQTGYNGEVRPSGNRLRKDRGAYSVSRKGELAPRSFSRTVTVPQAADFSGAGNTFAQRQERLRRERSRSARKQAAVVGRTFAQTGSWATSGRMKAVPRPLPPYRTSVPKRSGRYGKIHKSWLARLLSFIGVAVLLMLLGSIVFNGDFFRIRQVKVLGTSDAALIRTIQALGEQGQNILSFDVTGLERRIAALPEVQHVVVTRQFPAQLTVMITLNRPVLLWETSQGTYSIALDGKVIATAQATPGADHLGVIDDITGQSNKFLGILHPGMYLNAADVSFALAALQNIPAVTGTGEFKLYYDGTMYASTPVDVSGGATNRGAFIIEDSQGWKAYLGGSQDTNSLANRLLELRALLNVALQQRTPIATIDLRYGLRPVYTVQ